MEQLYRLPVATIAAVNGHCMGGGVGLISACDVWCSIRDAKFALREILLGIAPATISPYVLRKMGEGQAHDYFLTGRTFNGDRAYELSLVNEVVADRDALMPAVDHWIGRFLRVSPNALRATKELMNRVSWAAIEAVQDYTVDTIATLRESEEGQEGFNAFFEKRKPSWDPDVKK